MLSVVTNIHNNKNKVPTLMALFTATGKLIFFFTTSDVRCVHHGWHGTHRYDIQVLVTHASTWVHRHFSLLQWSVPLDQRGHVTMVGRIPGLLLSFYLYRFRKYVSYGFPIINYCNPGVRYETPCIVIWCVAKDLYLPELPQDAVSRHRNSSDQ